MAALVVFGRSGPVARGVATVVARIEAAGPWAGVIFVAAYVSAVVLMVPGSALTLAAGYLFGAILGTILVSLGSTLGAALAFAIARSIGRERVRLRFGRDPRLSALDRAVADRGVWVVFLLRLSPLVPFNLLNYALGLTGIGFWRYVAASWVGMLPGTVLYVMIGATFGPRGRPGGLGPWSWAAVLVATLAATVYVGRLAKNALRLPEAAPE